MSDKKEYQVIWNVGASKHEKVLASSVEEALDASDNWASLCHQCANEVDVGEGDDVQVYLGGELVHEEIWDDGRITRLKCQLETLIESVNRFLSTKATADRIALAEISGFKESEQQK